jgi:anti-sigma B factor antagonist
MTLLERQVGDVTVLELEGRLVYDEGDEQLRSRINELVARGRLKIVLDLRGVTYIDSCGLGSIVGKFVSVRRKGGDVKLLNLSPRSHRVIDISGLLRVFETFESEADAVTSFAAARRPV